MARGIYLRQEIEWWQPGADTLAYYPLKTDGVGTVGGTATLDNNTTFENGYCKTDTKWLSCPLASSYNFSNSAYTFSIRLQPWQYPSYNPRVVADNDPIYCVFNCNDGMWLSTDRDADDGGKENRCWKLTGIWTWDHLVITYDGTSNVSYLYINWVKYTYPHKPSSSSSSVNTFHLSASSSTSSLDNSYWYFNEFIIESKVWSDQDVLDYYNETKWNYNI